MPNKVKVALGIALISHFTFTVKAQESSATFADLVPFVTTPWEVVEAMLKIAEVDSSDMIIDLGSGDGRIPIRSAVLFGTKGIGVEIDAELVEEAKAMAKRKTRRSTR